MAPNGFPPPALSAPDLTGPVSILNWPVAGPRSVRRHRQRPYAHVRIEIDLAPPEASTEAGLLARLARSVGSRGPRASRALLTTGGLLLHAFASDGFVRVLHWEVAPGGWLPVAGSAPPDGGEAEPLGRFERALADAGGAAAAARARRLAFRLGATDGRHADVVVRPRSTAFHHAATIDLVGRFPESSVSDLVGAIHRRIPLSRARVTQAAYATE
ncbi:MAG: hypothetical protein QXG65_04660 [Thermoplasmata archaeon]